MQTTYIPSSNTATNGVALGTSTQDVRIYKILIGLPTDAANLTVFNNSDAFATATTNIAFKLTQPTAAAGKDWVRVVDFGPHGLPVTDGGNVVSDATNQITVIWGLADESFV